MEKYQRIAYLLSCYMIIADREINALEVDVLESYFPIEQNDDLYTQRQLIFSDDEGKIELRSLLSDLKLTNITTSQKQEIVGLLAKIAYGDDYMATQERELLYAVANALNINADAAIKECATQSESRIKSSRLSGAKRTIGKIENFIYNHIPGEKSDKTIDLLLGSLGYSTSIEEITDNALVDLERVSKIVDQINGALEDATQALNSMSFEKRNSTKEVQEVEKTISDIKTHFDSIIDISLKENLEVLNKKRRNIRYFTIAFMGRTKAGKSTLHKVITQQDNDDIGVGKLRTTRYNRSWYWHKLRIVDTPGIGAPGGAADTEIAKSIIDEADVIVYIVTSDSIQETEFDFFETIKERNKPLYIVLNVKSNLTQSVRLKRFLENPTAWKENEGPQSIQGHLDRIHERLDGKYNMDAVQIIPIHLLAAQLGFSTEHPTDEAQTLRDGSNIFVFTRSVQTEVHKSGGIKKSLSVVDGTSYQIHQIGTSIVNDLKQLNNSRELLEKKLNSFNSFIKGENTKLFGDLESIFTDAKSELKNRASAFASENYDNKNAGKKWGEDANVKAIYSRMNNRLQQRMEDYNEKVKSHINEIADDLKVLGAFRAYSNVSGESITNTKLGVGIFGALLCAAIPLFWNPAGWGMAVIAGVGLVVSWIRSLFDSKAEKKRKATEKMRDQLHSSIDSGINTNKNEFINEVKTQVNKTSSAVSELLSAYIEGAQKISQKIQTLCSQCENGESVINSLVSFRILEYVGEKVIKDSGIKTMDNNTLVSQYPVVRDWEHQSLTYKYKVDLSANDIAKISQATQMKIFTK